MSERLCDWCHGPIPDGARPDAKFCGKRHRQAAWRFAKGARPSRRAGETRRVVRIQHDGSSMTFAYADPPYPGKARRYYQDHPDYGGEVDHAELVARLERDYPAAWALSTSAEALPEVLAVCPPGVRVAAWVRGERPVPSYRPLNGWEPVIYVGGRGYTSSLQERRVDALVLTARPRFADPQHVIGEKPAGFWPWLFDLLGALPGDEFVDLFPGSARGERAWRIFEASRSTRATEASPPTASATRREVRPQETTGRRTA